MPHDEPLTIEQLVSQAANAFDLAPLVDAAVVEFKGARGLMRSLKIHLDACPEGSNGAIRILDLITSLMLKAAELHKPIDVINTLSTEEMEAVLAHAARTRIKNADA